MQGAEATPYALRRVVAETMAAAMRVITRGGCVVHD
jgi:hypothetical protein